MNPEARRVTPAMQRVVVAALEGRFKLEATETHARDTAVDIAREAVERGCEYVVAFGGDGLINEVANGMARSDATLGIIPGGTMNVFARNLGVPTDALEATDLILGADQRPSRRVWLGRANDRYFTFACGCGFDAEAAARAEQRRASKDKFGEFYFYGAALSTFLSSYAGRQPFLRCRGGFGDESAVMAVALTGGPYAYLLGRPVQFARTSGRGLNLFMLRRLLYRHLPVYGIGALLTGGFGGQSRVEADVEAVTVTSQGAFPYHVDGEPLAPTTRVDIEREVASIEVLV